jgi:hypothetical protein
MLLGGNMKKFRKWLIHKLGGYTKEDVEKLNRPLNYILSESKRNVNRIFCSKHITSNVMNYQEEIEEEIKEEFLSKALDRVKETYKPKLTCTYNEIAGIYIYKMVFEYLEPRED